MARSCSSKTAANPSKKGPQTGQSENHQKLWKIRNLRTQTTPQYRSARYAVCSADVQSGRLTTALWSSRRRVPASAKRRRELSGAANSIAIVGMQAGLLIQTTHHDLNRDRDHADRHVGLMRFGACSKNTLLYAAQRARKMVKPERP